MSLRQVFFTCECPGQMLTNTLPVRQHSNAAVELTE